MDTLDAYLENLASADPVPGGGSAATLVASTGAALVAMIARISARNPKYVEHAATLSDIVAQSDALRERLSAARTNDERAFAKVVAAQQLPNESDAQRSQRRDALETALREAARAPLEAARLAGEVLCLAERTLSVPNRNLASDAGCAAEFGAAAITACAYNVRINHRYMRDEAAVAVQADELDGYEKAAAGALKRVRAAVNAALSRG